MAVYTYEIDTERNVYPNLTIEKILCDGEFSAWNVTANEGYVFYDENANDEELRYNEETGMEELVPVTYYYTRKILNPRYTWANFAIVAVPYGSVNENYIFGGVH